MESFKEFYSLAQKKGLAIFDEVEFSSKTQMIDFLNKLDEILLNKNVNLSFLNQDLVNIILKIKLNKENIKKFEEINFKDFATVFKEHNDSKRLNKIYNNFIAFLQSDFGLGLDQTPIFDRKLIETNSLNSCLKKDLDKENHIDKHIFTLNEKFSVEDDLARKCSKYGVEILFDFVEPSGKISVADFTLYFNKRLEYFTNLLSGRLNTENLMRISALKDLYDTNEVVSIVGLISDITKTHKGHFMITLEDKSGQIKCFVNKDKSDMVKLVGNFCLDEGIGVLGKIGNGIIWTDEFIIPSPPNSFTLKKTEEDSFVAFISDIHFGAKVFVDEAFSKMIDFLNGNTTNEKLNTIAKKIKHIIIAGDIIEGIGIYPNQGKDARVLTTKLQYSEAAMWLSQIPKDKSIIIIPGNHDSTRLSEPQLKIPYEKAFPLYNMENVIMLSNPARVKLFEEEFSEGLEFFIYHGGSLIYYADKIQELRDKGGLKVPNDVVKFLLEKRHLAPSHGSTLYIPNASEDPLVIKKIPDFFITGHTHKLSLSNYKGCTIISCGCWVEMSDYQEKLGMFPDVGKLALVNTKTRKPQILNFYIEKHNL